MAAYHNILLALDLHEANELLCEKAAGLASLYGATLSLLHVVEPLMIDNGYDLIPADTYEMEQQMVEQAKLRLGELGNRYSVDSANQYVEIGSTKSQIFSLASRADIDLIVVGSHGRHGVALLLGSTANAVLHGSPVDVLAVRLPESG